MVVKKWLVKRRIDSWVKLTYWSIMHYSDESKTSVSWLPTEIEERLVIFPTRKAAFQKIGELPKGYDYSPKQHLSVHSGKSHML